MNELLKFALIKIEEIFPKKLPKTIAVAVSGGCDGKFNNLAQH